MTTLKKIFFLNIAVLLCAASSASGLELAATARLNAMVSNNINRSVQGLEENGYIFTQGIGVLVSEEHENRSFLLSLDGGWEILESDSVSSSEEVYLMDLEYIFPLSATKRLEATAGAARQTETPEPDDPDQGRTLVESSEVGLLFGNVSSNLSSWEAGLNARWEKGEDIELEETVGQIRWSRDLSRVLNLSVEASGRDGSDDFEDISWQGSAVVLALRERATPTFSRTYTVNWEERSFEGNGDADSSRMAGIEVSYEYQRSPSFSHEGSLGFSLLTQTSGEQTWESSGSFSLEKELSRTMVADTGIGMQTIMWDPLASEREFTRQTSVQLGLVWAAGRTVNIEPRVEYVYEDIKGREIPDREDQTLIAQVSAGWTPNETWLMEFAFVEENQESTEPTEELIEQRLEFMASIAF